MKRRHRLLSAFSRFALRIFFRRIEILGLERVPTDRPLLIVSNHGNGLVDPMILYGFIPVAPKFLAKSTLWQHPIAKYVVRIGESIPVYRRQDTNVDTSKNVDTFERCYEVLSQGEAVALFPEGTSHDAPKLAELRTGAARIALGAEERYGPLGVAIVPVGLTFDTRHRFRSNLLLMVGEPIDPLSIAPELDDPRERVRQLTRRIDEGIRSITLNYESWGNAELIELATEVYLRDHPELENETWLAARLPIRQQFIDGYRWLREAEPETVTAAVRATRTYRRLLKLAGLRDDQVGTRYGARVIAGFIARTARLLFWTLPLFLVGLILNFLPYKIPRWIVAAMRLPNDQHATYKVLSSIVFFPVFWAVEAGLVGHRLGFWYGVAIFALAPLGGYVAIVFFESARSFVRESRAYLLLRTDRKLTGTIERQRERVLTEIEKLVERVRIENLKR